MNDDLFASNIKIQNKIFVNFFVFAKTSKQNRSIFVKKIIRNNKKTKKKVKKQLTKENRANLNTKISRPLTHGLTVYFLFSFLFLHLPKGLIF